MRSLALEWQKIGRIILRFHPKKFIQQYKNDFSLFFLNNKNGGSDCQPVANEFELKGCALDRGMNRRGLFYLRQAHRWFFLFIHQKKGKDWPRDNFIFAVMKNLSVPVSGANSKKFWKSFWKISGNFKYFQSSGACTTVKFWIKYADDVNSII